jgi:enoyl-CoA hydratase/carnithine racemase
VKDQEPAQVLVNVQDHGVAVVTLNRPERRNAWTSLMAKQLEDHLEALEDDDTVRVVVLTGAGRAFCVGLDPENVPIPGGTRRPWSQRFVPSRMTTPVLAAINGPAAGIGLAYAMHCDIRYVARDTKLTFAFTRRGTTAELALHSLLPKMIGANAAFDLLLSGRTFRGDEAALNGLACVPQGSDDVLGAALAAATDIAENCSPAGVAAAKLLLWQGLGESLGRQLDIEDDVTRALRTLPDFREGMNALGDRRHPVWTTTRKSGRDLTEEILARGSQAPRC